jgi:phosphate transport system ATP-binding protein
MVIHQEGHHPELGDAYLNPHLPTNGNGAHPEQSPQHSQELLPPTEIEPKTIEIDIQNLSAFYDGPRGSAQALQDINLSIVKNKITALIGPSGCGKSTLLRSINRMLEIEDKQKRTHGRVEGKILFEGIDLYAPGVDAVQVRRHIGMVFQQPNPFPTMSIYDNIAIGFKLHGWPPSITNKKQEREKVEQVLQVVGLWDEVKDKLKHSGAALSGGQQQRLCIARAIAIEPQVILMDEPTSALDPIGTSKIESLMAELAEHYTIVLVTHNMFQAGRVADTTCVLYPGEDRIGRIIECGPTDHIFSNPKDKRTEDFISIRVNDKTS